MSLVLPRRALLVAVWVVVAAASAAAPLAMEAAPTAGQTRVNEDAQLIGDFLKRVEAYLAVHKKADSTLPEATNRGASAEIDAHERALQRLIADARSKAKAGDVFTQSIRAYFRRQIARALAGPDGAQIRESVMEENPGPIRLRVNGRYPDTVPTSTMPPQILAALPKLPTELEFRFIGDRLILLDVHAQLVVDYMDDAIRN
jgi:hypothetical protein